MKKIIILLVVVCLFRARAYHRSLDWRNSSELFLSAMREHSSDLYKGLRLETLAAVCGPDPTADKKQCLVYVNEGLYFLNKVLQRVDKPGLPIIKYYGLDEYSEKAKAAFILSFILAEQKVKNPFAALEPYMKEVTDSQIVHHYLAYLVQNNKLDQVEELCKRVIRTKRTPPGLIGLSIVEQRKYKNYDKAEAYLKEALRMFKYDVVVMQEAMRFYVEVGRPYKYQELLKLYKLRIHYGDGYGKLDGNRR